MSVMVLMDDRLFWLKFGLFNPLFLDYNMWLLIADVLNTILIGWEIYGES